MVAGIRQLIIKETYSKAQAWFRERYDDNPSIFKITPMYYTKEYVIVTFDSMIVSEAEIFLMYETKEVTILT